ncbi:End3p KNAG_0B05180 [Huiozyma naganishii CBS 8797]|uniref:Actin cytoskeleton-regulatory complex protein END3 n=1 Tax=Huiozyma naganishii (strain ATCC MYA-139 / BCRC 22969 / CBS 8797 / KCTC 17520 / NBRC 10181 / NCYC 3082 / Yp74L-3) TaxID=1071383 RepID=J7R2B2_HUIN7|nr:hypothetical protein KNAG_0B05180 [Kazachstania naganishii CBS 8797]CCK68950.1 hypothetical protein KNAG_0B05180 [Kazachstania naganishii CBS 8797]
MPKLEQFEIKKYWQIFSGLKPVSGKVTHDQVLPILYNSKQDSSVLNKIWFLADIDEDDQLDFEEFVICMRVVFDMVNKNIDSVPDELPDWLVPGSKAKLVKERQRSKQKEDAELPPSRTPPKVDWYMLPEDRDGYKKILETCPTATDGTYTYPALNLVLKDKFFNIGVRDMDKTWALVNPRGAASVDQDPALYFVHVLRQRNDEGAEIPSELPAALAEVFKKQEVQYDLKSEQAQVRRTAESTPSVAPASLAVSKTATSSTPISIELNTSNITLERAQLIREQLEGLLKYREGLLAQPSTSSNTVNVDQFTEDLDNIEQQVGVLDNYLKDKKTELNSLREGGASSQ